MLKDDEIIKVLECCSGQTVKKRDYVLEQNVSTYNKVDYCSHGERKE